MPDTKETQGIRGDFFQQGDEMMEYEVPERMYVWLDDIAGWLSSPRPQPNGVEMIRKDAACVEVKEGYDAAGYNHDTRRGVPLSEALTIRTVEDVRREAVNMLMNMGFVNKDTVEAVMAALANTHAPSREEECQRCGSSGYGCYECTPEPQPTPSPEPVAWRCPYTGQLVNYQMASWQPLYASPPTPASHAEELRKAKAEAWEQGWQDRLENEGLNCPIVFNPYRRSTDEGEG